MPPFNPFIQTGPQNPESAQDLTNLITGLTPGDPLGTGLVPYVAEPTSRVVIATATDAGTDGCEVNFGGLSGIVGTDFTPGSDGATYMFRVAEYAQNNYLDIGFIASADQIVWNGDNTMTITFNAGTAANSIACTTNDPSLAAGAGGGREPLINFVVQTTAGTNATPYSTTVADLLSTTFIVKTADFDITSDQSGATFANVGAGADIVGALPTTGLIAGQTHFGFLIKANNRMLTASSAAGISFLNSYALGTMSQSILVGSNSLRAYIHIVWDGALWIATSQLGTWQDND